MRFELKSDGITLWVHELVGGAGPPLVLIHGYAGTHADWRPAVDCMRSRRRVFAVDLRGHGDSAWAPDGDYSLESTVRDLTAVVDGLGLDRLVVGGHSTGGMTALWFAASHPERVAALLLVDVDPFRFKDGLARLLAFRGPESADHLEAMVRAIEEAGDRRPRPTIRRWLAERVRRTRDGRYTWKQDPRLRPAVRVEPANERSDAEVEDIIRAVRSPTLLVRGARSSACTHAGARGFLGRLHASLHRLEEIDDAGHGILLERPVAVAAAIDGFLDAVAASTLPEDE